MENKILLLGDTLDRSNWGCRATSGALRKMLEKSNVEYVSIDMLHIFEEDRISSTSQLQGVSLLSKLWIKITRKLRFFRRKGENAKTPSDPYVIENLHAIEKEYREGRRFIKFKKAAEQASYLLINGEGAFLKDRSNGRLKLILANLFVEVHGKKASICNHTADLNGEQINKLAKLVYPKFDSVWVREEYSLNELKKLGIINAEFAADAAFIHRPHSLSTLENFFKKHGYFNSYPSALISLIRPYIVVSGSSYFNLPSIKMKEFESSLAMLLMGLNKLLPVVVVVSSIPDDTVIQPIAQKLGIPFISLNTSVDQALDILGNARLHVGGRWHPAIMAATGGTPSIMLDANSPYKSNGILRLLSLEQPRLFHYETLEEVVDEIIILAENYLQQGDQLRKQILERSEELARSSWNNISSVMESH